MEKIMTDMLKAFKRAEITKDQLQNYFDVHLFDVSSDKPVYIRNSDLILILDLYRDKNIDLHMLIDWINVTWFTELYECHDDDHYSLGSVSTFLEQLDEDEYEGALTPENLERIITALSNNWEIWYEDGAIHYSPFLP